MKSILTGCFLALCGLQAAAQSTDLAEGGCATVTTPQEQRAVYDFVQKGAAFKSTGVVDTIPLTVHIVGTDAGKGYYSADNLFTVLCRLNQHYAPTGFYFALQWPLDTINKTAYYNHTNFWDGYDMMAKNNVLGTVNVYFVSNPAGACGYFAPGGDAVAIGINCAGPQSTTLTHELGHFMGLPHTFLGWEGGQTPSNPEKVTRGAGANCNSAGDGFCDTDADYLAERWSCPYNKPAKYDTDGVLYHPDSSLYMGYSTDACMARFSPMQMAYMRDQLYTQRGNLLQKKFPAYHSLDTPRSALLTDSIWTGAPKMVWHRVPYAERYRVRFAASNLPSYWLLDVLTADTVLQLPTLYAGVEYQVTIEPLSGVNLCRQNKALIRVTATGNPQPTGVMPVAGLGGGLSLSPNPAAATGWQLQASGLPAGSYEVRVYALDGRLLQRTAHPVAGGQLAARIDATGLANGIYLVSLEGTSYKQTLRAVLER